MRKTAVLICFSIKGKEFENIQERNKFFRALYGWKQIVPTKNKIYEYRREGLLDKIPHTRIDQSSFIIPNTKVDELMEFFERWADKVIWRTFKILLEEDELEEFFEV